MPSEPPAADHARPSDDDVARRLAQQALIAEFSRIALGQHDLDRLLAEACRLAAEGLATDFAKVLEYRDGDDEFLLRAGVGWPPEVIGRERTGADLASPAGYAFRTGEPVVANQNDANGRFRTPKLMARFAMRRALNVVIAGESGRYGVLEADSRDPGKFSVDDVAFLSALAGALGVAIEKERARRQADAHAGETRRSEAFVRSILDASPDCIKVVELDGTLSFMNANGLCAMEIGDAAAVIGRRWSSLWPEAAAHMVEDAVAAARDGRARRFEAYCPTACGAPRWWDVSVAPILGDDGVPARLVSISRDISDRVRAAQAVADSEARFRALTEAAPGMVWTADAQGWIDYMSPGWVAVTGREVDLAAPDWGLFFHPDDIAPVGAALRAAVATGARYEVEFRLLGRDGRYRWFLSRAVPVRGGDGAVTRWVGTSTDIDRQKTTETALVQALADKDLLAREIDHRVKNSLAMVSSLLSLQERSTESEEVRSALAEASSRVMTIAGVHAQLYQSDDLGSIDVAAYLTTLCGDLAASLGREADAAVEIDADPLRLPVARAAPLGLIAAELVTNALKYARAPEGRSRICVTVRTTDADVLLIVADDGPGLPPGFDPSRSRGLGMRIVRSLARQLGGAVQAGNACGGARFVVRAPLTSGGEHGA